MNRLKTLLWLLIAGTSLAAAAPKQTNKAVANIITYKSDGSILGSGYGFFISATGEAVAPYHLFQGAYAADIIDSGGRKYRVSRIVGAQSTRDLVRFTTEGVKKADYLEIAASPALESDPVNQLFYSTDKKSLPRAAKITQASDYAPYKYFETDVPNEARFTGCPLVDAEGRVVAITQPNVAKDAATACAIDARFVNDLRINALSALDTDLRDIRMPKQLPETPQDALTYIYMLGSRDSLLAETAYNDYITAYPDSVEGYTGQGTFYAETGRAEKSAASFAKALTLNHKQDEVHYALSKTILAWLGTPAHPDHTEWTYARAAAEAAAAYTLQPYPLYLYQEARCLFADKQYAEAAEKFDRVCTGDFASRETYFAAAKAHELAGTDSTLVLARMDSAISCIEKPYKTSDAPYFLEHARIATKAGEHRKAVSDYNQYEILLGPSNLTARFYFLREQAELQGRMFQQALDDIRTARHREPEEPLYALEQAVVELRCGLYDEAIASAEALLALVADNADAYKIIGIAKGEQGKPAEARKWLEKAVSLGDETAQEYLQKYQ